MNPKYFQLLSYLRENSREKLTCISKHTNIPISTLFDSLKQLQEKVITKHTILINFQELGYHTQAQVFLKIGKSDIDIVKNFLNHHHNVNSIYKINNGWDFLIETVHKNNRELDMFLELIQKKYNIEKHEIHYLIDEIKKEGFMNFEQQENNLSSTNHNTKLNHLVYS